MNTGLAIAATVVLLAANAFFVGAEFAVVSARRESLEDRVRAGSRRARTTVAALANVSRMMAAAQLGTRSRRSDWATSGNRRSRT